MVNIAKLKEEQIKLAKKVITTDMFDRIKTIGGADYLYTNDSIICVIVVLDYKTKEVLEKKCACEKLTMPYIPGYLSYRVAPATIKAWEKLNKKPDVLMIAANGILHPRKIGAASAIGLFLDIPTIGIAKKMLCGEEQGGSIILEKEVVGKRIETKDKANPIFVSSGHRISLTKTVDIVKEMLIGHKMPEPLYLAHKIGNKIKKRYPCEKGNEDTKEKGEIEKNPEEKNE